MQLEFSADNSRIREDADGPNGTIEKAIILAAGIGARLLPFTHEYPKCLAPVNGVPILVNALDHLSEVGIREVVIVVGHHKEKIYDRVGQTFKDMKISYIESENYASTNNIYSLWLAREHLVEDVLLLEGDVFFELRLLEHMLSYDGGSLAAVARHQSWMSGTVVSVDKAGNIQALMEGRDQGDEFDYSKVFKTANVYLFRGDFLRRHFVPHLEAYIRSGEVDEYYEVILHAMVHRGKNSLRAVECDDLRWYEIDDESDRLAAEYMFSSQEQRYEYISSQHGGYWRYDFVDHAFLYNLYFPPEPVFAHFKNHLKDLVLNYPAGQAVLAQQVGTLIDEPTERIVVANGASELIKIISSQVRTRMILPVPSFNEYENTLPSEKLVCHPLTAPSFELDVDAFAAEATKCEADIAVIVTPNNPTSLVVPKADLLRLTEKLARHNCMLIVDESFIDFAAEPGRLTMRNEIRRHSNLAIVMSMSKAYGIGGLRIGYLATSDLEFAQAVRKETPIWNINGFAESFLRLLPRYRREFTRSCERVRADCDVLYRGLSSIPGMTTWEPSANFVMCRVPDDASSAEEVCRALFVEHNVFIKHCAGKTMSEANRYIRVASRTQDENRRLVAALKSVLTPARSFKAS